MTLNEFDWLEKIIKPSLAIFYEDKKTPDLFVRNLHEITLVAEIYYQMRVLFSEYEKKPDFNLLSIDMEYNRNHDLPKEVFQECRQSSCDNKCCHLRGRNPENPENARPDILIHERNENYNNQVIIEFKKGNNSNGNNGRDKLTYFTCQEATYKYKKGFFIILDQGSRKKIEIYEKGKKLAEEKNH